MSHAVEVCPGCQHLYSSHTADGCWYHDAGVICECRALPPEETRTLSRAGWENVYAKLSADIIRLVGDQSIHLTQHIEKLKEQLRVQTERAERLDAENNERFSKETEYQNRIRTLEQKLRDIGYYARRDLP